MQLPLYIFQVGDAKVNRIEKTRDISSGGVSFLSGDEIGIGDRVDYMITLSRSNPPVRIRCLGKVLRSQKASSPKSDNPVTDGPVADGQLADGRASDGRAANGQAANGQADGQVKDVVAPFEVAVTMERYSFVKAEELSELAMPA